MRLLLLRTELYNRRALMTTKATFTQRLNGIRQYGHIGRPAEDRTSQPICSLVDRQLYEADQGDINYKSYTTTIAPIFLAHGAENEGISSMTLTENGSQFVPTFLSQCVALLG